MSLYSAKRFRKSLLHFLLGRAAQGLVALVFTLLLVRVMESTAYGAYLVLIGMVDLFRPLSSLGVLQMAQQYLPELSQHATHKQFRRFLWWTRVMRVGLLAVFSVALYFVWQPVSTWLGFVAADPLPAWLPCAAIAAMLGAEFVEQMLEALLDQKAAQVLRLLYAVGRLAAMMVLAGQGTVSLQAMLLIDTIAAACCWLGAEVALRRKVQSITPDGSRSFETGEFVRFAWHMAGSQVLNAASSAGALRLVVARVLGLEAAGIFGFLQTLIGQLNRLLPAVMLANLIRPMLISRRVQGQSGLVADACALLWRSNFLFLWPLIPVVYGGGHQIAYALSGGRTSDGLALGCMFIALITMTQAQVNAIILQVHKRSGDLVRAAFLALTAPVLVALGAQHSLAGAAFGLFAAYAVRSSFTTWLIQRSDARMTLDARGAVMFAGAIVAAAALAMAFHLLWSLPATMVAYAVLFLVLLPIVKPLNRADAAVINDALGRRMPWLVWFTSSTRP